ncbi:hypothetical protein [Arenimonas sp.]|uniref:hypothetical protein n=1 Tax=Arenimonas sp. TaxID=1872635 RepID=UPI0039E563FF
MSLYAILALFHAGLGTLALATFWIAGLSRKGSPLHKGAGKLYLLAMAGLLAAALPMSLRIMASGRIVIGCFLLYLLVISVTAVWNSWRAIRDRRDWRGYTGPVYRGLMWLNLASGLGIAYVGLFEAKAMQLIITAFSGIGLAGFVGMWRFARRAPEDPRWWLREHLTAMLGNGVATHIAFLSIGLPRLFPELGGSSLQNIAWLGPLLVAFVAGAWLTRKYLPKRSPRVAGAVG